jgi:hypothetical protein
MRLRTGAKQTMRRADGKFAKGESGNPGGRPKAIGELRALARAHAADAIEELARLAVKAKSETARVAAIRELLDRGFGKPAQAHAIEITDRDPYEDKSAEELRGEIVERLIALGIMPPAADDMHQGGTAGIGRGPLRITEAREINGYLPPARG